MYQAQHYALARAVIAQRVRPKPVQGVRRGARLISLEIRRSRQAEHLR